MTDDRATTLLARQLDQLQPSTDADERMRARIDEHVRRADAPRAARLRTRRIAVVAAAAAVLVLSGAVAIDLRDSSSGPSVGLTPAQAAAIAFDALDEVADMTDFDATQVQIDTEIGGEQRVEKMTYNVRREASNVRSQRAWTNDFSSRSSEGLTKMCVSGRCYQATASTRYPQPWMLEAEAHGAQWALGMPWPGVDTPPDMQSVIERLEREQITSAERDADGNVRVSFDVRASALEPVGTRLEGGWDILTSAAVSFANRSSDEQDPELVVEIEARHDGTRTLRVTGDVEHVEHVRDGGVNRTERVPSTHELEWSWAPIDEPQLIAPDPIDVLVVGMAGAARKGDTSIYGVHGTLDEFTDADLKTLARQVSDYRNTIGNRTARHSSPRSFPDLWKRQARQQQLVDQEIRAEWVPLDRAAMSRSDQCEPFWPDSLRAMKRSQAEADPDAAGWRCSLSQDRGSFSVLPASSVIDVRGRVGRHGSSLRQIETDSW